MGGAAEGGGSTAPSGGVGAPGAVGGGEGAGVGEWGSKMGLQLSALFVQRALMVFRRERAAMVRNGGGVMSSVFAVFWPGRVEVFPQFQALVLFESNVGHTGTFESVAANLGVLFLEQEGCFQVRRRKVETKSEMKMLCLNSSFRFAL